MLSTKHAQLAVKVLALLLVAAISFFFAGSWISNTDFVKESLDSVEKSSQTVMAFSAATLSTSLAISALPDDFATPLADSLADMNVYFVAILVVLFLEKLLIQYGVKLAFSILIPWACFTAALSVVAKKEFLKGFAVRLCVFGLVVAFVVPFLTLLSNRVLFSL